MAERAAELARTAAERQESPLQWAITACSTMHEAGVAMPSIELARLLLEFPSAQLMPYIDHSIAAHLVFPLHMLSLLTARIIPVRQQQPEMYGLFLSLLKTYTFTLCLNSSGPGVEKFVKSILETLELPVNDDSPKELGSVAVHFLLALSCRLVDSTAEDWSMGLSSPKPAGSYLTVSDFDDELGRRREELEQTRSNSLRALELVTNFVCRKRTCVLLRLARRNLPEQWGLFVQKLQFLEVMIRDTTLGAPREATELFSRLASAIQQGLNPEAGQSRRVVYKALLDTNSSMSAFGNAWGTGRSAPWLPFDIFMEDALEGRRVPATSTAESLADLMRSLHAVQGASWHDVFLGLWTAGLRHVNREREYIEGPRPHVESRLCMLLSIVPLASAGVIEEEETSQQQYVPGNISRSEDNGRRAAFISSLQVLGQFEGLLCPPPVVVPAANQAAMKASTYVAGLKTSQAADINKTVGNMRHLIVEICILRGLLDTSAYRWPGYAVAIPHVPPSGPSQPSPWAAFMEGASLAGPLKASLISTPASSLAELEKVYHTAMSGAESERPAAASILCGASLVRSWHIQEHVVRLAVRLLSPPAPSNNQTGNNSFLLQHAPMILAALSALTEVDAVHVLSLYGVFPELAAALLPICELYGSTAPSNSGPAEEVSPHMVFSVAFVLLLRLWKFHRPPLEHRLLGFENPLGGDLSLDYILQLRNLSSKGDSGKLEPVTLDSFPNLKAWYTQNQACVASTLSGLVPGNPVHQNADRLLNMMFRRMKSGSAPTGEETSKPMIPAWEIMTAVPFVLDAVLTACGHGRLSSRDLTTGLRDLVDFLPGSIATIVSYFTAEVTRGLWKYASMNGNDWPSPAANLLAVEAEIKDILAATGVQVPNLVTGSLGGNAPVSLPLPLAAFLSLTITYRQDKPSELVLGVAGPALESTAGGSPWPSMPIVAALWAQKVKRWHSFIVFGASRTVFKQDKKCVKQLLRSCFAATIGSPKSLMPKLQVHGGVGALLGHGGMQGGQYPLAPGILYLGIYPGLHEIMFVTDEILLLVVDSVRQLTSSARGSKASFANSISRVLQASTLGASLLHISGGSTLVQGLYSESLPAWFLAGNDNGNHLQKREGSLLEGYAVAHFSLLSGALVWGISSTSNTTSFRTRRQRVLGSHMEFLASALDGNIVLGCGRATWRAYVTGFVTLLVNSTPNWVLDVNLEVLKRVAKGLKMWHEQELAIALLERGGPSAMCSAAEMA